MKISNVVFHENKEFELSYDHKEPLLLSSKHHHKEFSELLENQQESPKKTQEKLKKESLQTFDSLKTSISTFYNSKSISPIHSYLSWMGIKKNINPTKLYKQIKEFSFCSTESLELLDQKTEIFCMLLSNDNSTLITGCENNLIYLWDMNEKKIKNELHGHTSKVICLALDPKNQILLSGSYDNSIIIWELDKGVKISQLTEHTEGILTLAFAPNGQTFASGSEDKTIIIWSLKERMKIQVLKGHTSAVAAILFVHNGEKLISGSWDTSLRIWDIETESQEALIGEHEEMIRTLAISPDESILASAGADKTIRVWSLKENKQIALLEGHIDMVRTLVISSDSSKLISAGWDKAIRIWDLKKMILIKKYKGHTNTVRGLSITSDDKYIFSGGWDSTIRIWSLENIDQNTFTNQDNVTVLAMTPNGKNIFSAHHSTIILWEIHTANQKAKLIKHQNQILAMEVTKKGDRLISADVEAIIHIWDLQTFNVICTLFGHNNSINSLRVHPNDLYLISGGYDQFLCVYNLNDYEKVMTLGNGIGPINCLEISSEGDVLLTGNMNGIVRLWSFIPFEQILELVAHEKTVTSVRMTTNKQKFITASLDFSVKIWKTSSGKLLYNLNNHSGPILSIVLNEEGTKLISGSEDGSIRLWDVRLGTQIGIAEIPKNSFHSLILSPDGTKVIASFEENIKIWEVSQLHILKQLENEKAINCILLTPGEKTMLTGGDDNLIRVWDISTMTECAVLEGHSKPVRVIKSFASGDFIVSGSSDNTIRIWDLNKKNILKVLKGSSSPVSCLELLLNDKFIISGCHDSTVRIWDISDLKKCTVNHVFQSHKGPVTSLCVSDSGKIYVSGSKDKTIIVGDLDKKAMVHCLYGHLDTINCLVIFKDESKVISGSSDKTIIIWNLKDGNIISTLKSHHSAVVSMIINPKNMILISGASDGTLHLWDLQQGKQCINFIGNLGSVNGLAMNEKESMLVSVGSDQTIRIWRLEAVEYLPFLEGHSEPIIKIALTKDEEKLISIAHNVLILWDITESKPFRKFQNSNGKIKSMALLNNGDEIILATTKEIIIWNIKLWCQNSSFLIESPAEILIITPDNKKCIVGCNDTVIRVWDLESQNCLFALDDHFGCITALVISSDGLCLASGSSDGSIIIWDFEKGTLLKQLRGHKNLISALLITEDNKTLISGAHDKKLMIWSLNSLKESPEILEELPFQITSMIFEPNEEKLIIGCSKIEEDFSAKPVNFQTNSDYAYIYDAKSLKKVVSFQRNTDIQSLCMYKSGESVISGSSDRSIYFWSLENYCFSKQLLGHSNKIISELMSYDASKLILGCDDRNIVVWDLAFAKLHTIFKGHVGRPTCLAIKMDSSKLVSGSDDKSIKIWCMINKNEIAQLQGHSSAINCITFSKNELQLLSGSDDKSIRIWDFSTLKIITVLDGHKTAISSIQDLSNGDKIISGDRSNIMIIWDKINDKEFLLKKSITLDSKIERIILSPNRKIVLIMLNTSKIQIFRVEEWSHLAEIDGKLNNFRTVPIFLSDKNNRFIIYFNRIIDCLTGKIVFQFQINQWMESFFFDEKNCSFYFISINFHLEKIEKSWLQAYFFNYMNYDSIGNMPQNIDIICKQKNCSFPFLFSFLHLISIFDKAEYFTESKLVKMFADEGNLELKIFYDQDIFFNTPLDILILKKNTSLIIKYFEFLFKCFEDESCPFYQKVRFLNYNFCKGNNFLGLMTSLLSIFSTDLEIISHLLELALMDLDPKLYDNSILYEQLDEPILIETEEIFTINKNYILTKLKEKLKFEEKHVYEKATCVKAKILCIPNISDITVKKTAKIFEHFSNCEPSNDIFSNKVVSILMNHIWEKQIRFYYFVELIIFFICFLIYNIGHIYLMPSLKELDEGEDLSIISFMIVKNCFIILYSIFCLSNEIKQMISTGFTTYFKNIWNYYDIALIPLMISTSVLNFIVIFKGEEEGDYIKLVNAICMFCFWFRFLSFFRAIKETSSMMRLIFNVITSVRYFVLFMVFFMLTLATSFFLLHEENDSNETIFDAIFAFYSSTVGDSSAITDFPIVFPNLKNFFMIASTFLFAIILLNLLVAIIGDKHQEINDCEEKTRLYELTNIIVDTNSNLITQLVRKIRKPRKRSKYLIYLYNENHIEKISEDGIDKKIQEYFRLFQNENLKSMKEKMSEMEKFIENQMIMLKSEIKKE